MTDISQQLIMPCRVCGKQWRRCDTDKYYYFSEMVVCCNHRGAAKWYEGALEIIEEALEYKGLIEKRGAVI